MTEILALLQNIAPLLEKTTFKQMSRIIFAMLASSGRITMLGLSRWAEKGGSYRTIQRFYQTLLPWTALQWMFFQSCFLKANEEYIAAGDESVVSKAGKQTYGLERFFAGLQQRVIPGLSFFVFSLVNVREEHSYPLQVMQTVKSVEEKAASKAKVEAKKNRNSNEKKKPGRPKGSKNKDKKEVILNPELLRIQKSLQTFLDTLKGKIKLVYLAMDGHFGNYPSAYMVRQVGIHLISKLRSDAALYETCLVEKHKKRGPKPKYGAKLDIHKIDLKYLKETSIEDRIQTDKYQGQFFNKEFAFALNVVIIVKTNLDTGSIAHVILFSTDLGLTYNKMIKFYSLRFQLEFNFRDAKQYWGLEDFMNVKETAVTNAANLSFFLVNFSYTLLKPFRKYDQQYSILDLKSHYRGLRYATETIKMLPEKPDAILLADIFQHIARLGAIHPASMPVSGQ
jgi:hypothetical protein